MASRLSTASMRGLSGCAAPGNMVPSGAGAVHGGFTVNEGLVWKVSENQCQNVKCV